MKNYSLFSEFLMRTPTLPLSDLWDQLATNDSSDQWSVSLMAVFQDPKVQEALFIGSPNLHQRCLEWLRGEISDDKERRKLEQSLLRYYSRMHTRCTPFGLFAACSMGSWAKETKAELKPLPHMTRNTRLDMHYLCALAQQLEKDPALRPFLTYYPNSSIYAFGQKLRYVEYIYKDGVRHHQITGVESNDYLARLLEAAKDGASFEQLVGAITDEEVTKEEAIPFIHDVINSQVLVSELEPAITGDDLLEQMLEKLQRIQDQAPQDSLQQIIDLLGKVWRLLMDLDRNPEDDHFTAYGKIKALLDQLGIPYDIKKLFQVDMGRKAKHLHLQNRLAGSVRRGLEVLNRLNSRKMVANSNLRSFQDAFFQRYETKEMPLLQVLDNESGIGYQQSVGPGDTHPMIDDIQVHQGSDSAQSFQMEKQEIFLLKKLVEATKNGAFEVTLEEEEIRKFPVGWSDMPDTISVMGSVIGKEDEEEGLERILIKSAGNSSAANLMGRFTHLDPEIDRFTRKITAHEHDLHEDLIFAEIVHLPESRIGNILMRTQVRPYEIPFLAQASVEREHQISLQDLYLSVQEDRLVLRSKSRNKEIIPRMSTAHNYSMSSLPVYQFLCDLQFQQLPGSRFADQVDWVAGDVVDLRHQQILPGLGFDWGPMASHFRFLPRVTFQNLILHRAKWNLAKADYEALIKLFPAQRAEGIRAWREQFQMPQHVLIADFDNELFIDLEHPAYQEMFISTLKKRPNVTLVEFLFDPEKAVVRDSAGESYTNEFVMAFGRKAGKVRIQSRAFREEKPQLQRSFQPGSEWLYYKIYAGARASDELLSNVTLELVEKLKAEGLIDHWFFIRYADPDLHFRLRFHLQDVAHSGRIIQLANAHFEAAIHSRRIWKVQLDTYEREVERYGITSMELSEQLSYRDSEACLRFLHEAQDYEDPELLRWYYAMINIHMFLDAFQLDLEAKTQLMSSLQNSFAIEFNAKNKQSAKQLSEKYRDHREAIDDIVQGRLEGFPEELLAILQQKSAAITPACQEILTLEAADDLYVSRHGLLSSHIHMIMNRLFRSQQRKYELIIYDMLARAYRSALARVGKG